MKQKLTEANAKEWLKTIGDVYELSSLIIQCSAWSMRSVQVLMATVEGKGNVYSFENKKKFISNIEAFPDKRMRNFEQLGKELDKKIKKLNTLLPEGDLS